MLTYVVQNIFGWQFWLGVLLTILAFLWLFFGGKNHEYIGLSPLKIGVDASRYVDDSTYRKTEKSNKKAKQYTAVPVDNTPQIPKTKKTKKVRNYSMSSEYVDGDEPDLSDYVCMSVSFAEENHSQETQSPRTKRALGKCKSRKCKLTKGEKLCKQAIEEIYNKPFYTVRPKFLKNPETNRNLELDLYNDEIKIAVEYQGIQHYKWPNYTNCSYEDFIKQVRRDQFKVDRCDQEGIYLITVPYNVGMDYEKIKEYITYYLPENVMAREE